MALNKSVRCAAFAAGAIVFGSSAWAGDVGGFYFGGSFGRARNDYNTGMLDAQYESEATSAGDTLTITDRSTRRLAHAWWVDAGYYFSPYLAVEASFIHAGQLQYLSTGTLNVQLTKNEAFSTAQEASTSGPALAVVGRLPLTDHLALDARIGDYIGKAKFNSALSVDSSNSSVAASIRSSSLLAGAGAAYTVGEHWSVRLDYLRINKTGNNDTGKFTVDMAAMGISFTF